MGSIKKSNPSKSKINSIKKTSTSQLRSLNQTQIFICLIVLIAISFTIRVINIGELSLWVDEYVHIMRSKNLLNGQGPLFTDDNNGILYTIIMIPFNLLFGTTPFWGRFPSVLFGTAAVLLTYVLGKRLINSYVGFLSAFFMAFSLYQIYWSRLARNYAIFVCMFLVLVIVFWSWYESDNESSSVLSKQTLFSFRKLGLVFGALVLSLLSHQLTFFFLFGFCTYNIVMLLNELILNRRFNIKSRYFIIGIPSLVFFILIFTPFIAPVIQSLLSIILPDRVATWVIPDWTRLAELWKDKPFEVFNIYHGVFQYDTSYLYLLAIPGIIWGFVKYRKVSSFLFSLLFIPFLLMSFIFREPSLPRYLIYLEPLLFISISLFLYLFIRFAQDFRYIKIHRFKPWLSILPFLIAITPVKANPIIDLVLVKNKNGYQVDRRLAKWSFTDWSYPCQYVKSRMMEGDVILSTVPEAVNYYLEIENTYGFRQKHYNTKQKKYVMNEPRGTSHPSASTLENLKKTLEDFPHGWLLVDYYFDGPLVDQQVRNLVFRNMYHHPYASTLGDVRVFSWDKSSRDLSYQNIVVDLGRSSERNNSREFNMPLTADALRQNKLKLQINALWIDDPQEGAVIINKDHWYPFPTTPSERIESFQLDINTEHLKSGENTIQFSYNPDCSADTRKGFIVYYVRFIAPAGQ